MSIEVKVMLCSPATMEAFADFLRAAAVKEREDQDRNVVAYEAALKQAYDDALSDVQAPTHPYPEAKVEPAEEPKKRTRRTKAEMEAIARADATLNISTGNERVGPEDSPEVQAQDAADEKAEAEAKPAKELTADDLRQAIGSYAKKFGVAECQADGVRIFTDALGTPPEGKAWGISVIGTDQAKLAKAVSAWLKAGAGEARY